MSAYVCTHIDITSSVCNSKCMHGDSIILLAVVQLQSNNSIHGKNLWSAESDVISTRSTESDELLQKKWGHKCTQELHNWQGACRERTQVQIGMVYVFLLLGYTSVCCF